MSLTKMRDSSSPGKLDSNARREPSGENEGVHSRPGKLVNGTVLEGAGEGPLGAVLSRAASANAIETMAAALTVPQTSRRAHGMVLLR